MPTTPPSPERRALDDERRQLVNRLSRALEKPMIVLGFVWLVLVVVELTRGLSPFLERLGQLIWALFVLDFLLEFGLAPRKLEYVKHNWLTVLALVSPAFRVLAIFRVFRALRVVRAARGLRLLRVVSSVNRGMGSLGRLMGRRGLGYVAALTLIVVVSGAAGIYGFERAAGGAIAGFGDALWWTAMVVTTMGTDYFPQSAEGRLLCLLLATYGFAIFGYVTAAIASILVARDAEAAESQPAGARQLEALRAEIAALRREVRERGA